MLMPPKRITTGFLLSAALALAACVVDNNKPAPAPTPTPVTATPTPTAPTTTPTTPAPNPTPTLPPDVQCPDEASPTVSYTSKDPKVCSRALFTCKPGQKLFTNQCGCGCAGATTTPASNCPSATSPGVSFKSTDGKKCQTMRFACAAGEKPFNSTECGCGCKPDGAAPSCPDEAAAGVSYKSKDAKQCARMKFRCANNEDGFSNACGCGCVPKKGASKPPAAGKCPEAAVAGVDYKSKDTGFCSRARIMCGKGTKPFSSTCGCGCVPDPLARP